MTTNIVIGKTGTILIALRTFKIVITRFTKRKTTATTACLDKTLDLKEWNYEMSITNITTIGTTNSNEMFALTHAKTRILIPGLNHPVHATHGIEAGIQNGRKTRAADRNQANTDL